MRVELLRRDGDERHVVAVARWTDGRVNVSCEDEEVRRALVHAFRLTPVAVDDASFRRLGTHGEVVVQPGTLEWFRAVAFARAGKETGLDARLVPEVTEGGYDPAAGYRTFEEQLERLDRVASQRSVLPSDG